MPAAYTHAFIARKILDRILLPLAGTPKGQPVPVLIPALDGGQGTVVSIPYAMAALLARRPASFMYGATAPDFFVDVLTGITTSHQPIAREATFPEFLRLFAESLDAGREEEIAFLLGWLAHVCADVFGHHWVGQAAGGPFYTWVDTPPEVIRKHIGIEMTWDQLIFATMANRHLAQAIKGEFGCPVPDQLTEAMETLAPLVYERLLVERAMLSDTSPLGKKFYDDSALARPQSMLQIAHPLIELRNLDPWHEKQAQKAEALRNKLQDPAYVEKLNLPPLPKIPREKLAPLLEAPCPLCMAHGVVTETVERACPVCFGIGTIEKAARRLCVCGSDTTARVSCPKCLGIGTVEKALASCPICGGDGLIDCKVCGGDGFMEAKIFGKTLRVTCPVCADQRQMPCPHTFGAKVGEALRDTCPVCHGEREIPTFLEIPCPVCWAAKEGAEKLREICPVCKGARTTRQDLDHACPVCQGKTALAKILIDPKFTTLDLLLVICERLAQYHRLRRQRIVGIVAAYLRAHEHLAFLLVSQENRNHGKVAACFKDFVDQVGDFHTSQLTFIDLVPEIAVYGKTVEKAVKKFFGALAELMPEKIRNLLENLKKEALRKAVDMVSEKLDLQLTEPEAAKVRQTIGRYPLDQFPPLADAVHLFLLALHGAEPTRAGLNKAFAILDQADNIDGLGQPLKVRSYADAHFAWDRFFRLLKRDGSEASIRISW